jgi:16S rRNA (guanine527-N7)-methyltransferase
MPVRTDAAATERLHRFVALLLRWNAKLNLVAPGDEAVIWQRHVADSLQLVPFMPSGLERGIDLGSGGGFPGLVLAIATGIPFELVESDQRKASFLRTAVLETGAPATVHAHRIKAANLLPAGLVTARALAPLPRLLPLAAPFLAEGGICLLLKGARAEQEIAQATLSWEMAVTCIPSHTSGDGMIVRISGLKPKVRS